jgi:hypothetical protein
VFGGCGYGGKHGPFTMLFVDADCVITITSAIIMISSIIFLLFKRLVLFNFQNFTSLLNEDLLLLVSLLL